MLTYYIAILNKLDPEKSKKFRLQHLDYIKKLKQKGKIFKNGPFTDGSGGMAMLIADSFEEAKELAEQDPFVIHEARKLDLREWEVK